MKIEKMKFTTLMKIHSLHGAVDEVTVVEKQTEEKNNNTYSTYIVEYKGTYCKAIYNGYVGAYYADDLYGKVKQDENGNWINKSIFED